MKRFRTFPVGLGTILALVLPLAVAAPARAQKIAGEPIHFTDSFVEDDYCGVAGLSVRHDVTVDGRFLARLQGKDAVFYGMANRRVVDELTNVDTLQHATDIQPRTTDKDLRITVNDDGTITIVELLTGGERLLGDDGHLIASNSGQIRLRLVIDYNGTLSDPSDDTFISAEQIFGSTGTNDDFCAALLADWGITT